MACYELRNYPKMLILVDKFNKERRIELEVINEFNESFMITIWRQQGYEPRGYEPIQEHLEEGDN